MFNEINEKIMEYSKIFIFGHIRPDGDCYGAQFGLCEIIKENYKKKVYVVGDSSTYVSFLGTPDEIDSEEEFNNSLGIVVDCGSSERISDNRFKLCDYIIKIDHHIGDDNYGNYNYVEEDAPSCCQIIAKIVLELNLRLNPKSAFALYTGIVTDTGRFRFKGVNSETLMIASKLLKFDIDVEKLDNLLSVESVNSIKLKGYILNNCNFTDNGVAYILITRDIIDRYQVTDEVASSQVGLIGSIEGYPLYFLFIEYPTEIRIRLRSRGPRVDKLANLYGGGGHEKASGAHLDNWNQLEEFIEKANRLGEYFLQTGKDDLY